MWIECVCYNPSSGDKVEWIRLQLCSLTVRKNHAVRCYRSIDRDVAIQSYPIVEKKDFNYMQIYYFFHFLQNFDPLSLT